MSPPIRKLDGSWARNDMEKAEIFAKYLANVFMPNSSCDSPTLDNSSCKMMRSVIANKIFSKLNVLKLR